MSPRAAWRLETLGFGEVYDYVGGKLDWFMAGLPMEGDIDESAFIGSLVRREVPTSLFGETVGEVSRRVREAGWNGAMVVNERRILLGFLGGDALDADPSKPVEEVMLEGPVTFRPSNGLMETAEWMDRNQSNTVIVTSSDGSLLGIVRRDDIPKEEATGQVKAG